MSLAAADAAGHAGGNASASSASASSASASSASASSASASSAAQRQPPGQRESKEDEKLVIKGKDRPAPPSEPVKTTKCLEDNVSETDFVALQRHSVRAHGNLRKCYATDGGKSKMWGYKALRRLSQTLIRDNPHEANPLQLLGVNSAPVLDGSRPGSLLRRSAQLSGTSVEVNPAEHALKAFVPDQPILLDQRAVGLLRGLERSVNHLNPTGTNYMVVSIKDDAPYTPEDRNLIWSVNKSMVQIAREVHNRELHCGDCSTRCLKHISGVLDFMLRLRIQIGKREYVYARMIGKHATYDTLYQTLDMLHWKLMTPEELACFEPFHYSKLEHVQVADST